MILPIDTDLTLEELGLLSTMLNDIEADYTTLDYLIVNSSDSGETIIKILDSLINKKYIFKLNDKFIINKEYIPSMIRR